MRFFDIMQRKKERKVLFFFQTPFFFFTKKRQSYPLNNSVKIHPFFSRISHNFLKKKTKIFSFHKKLLKKTFSFREFFFRALFRGVPPASAAMQGTCGVYSPRAAGGIISVHDGNAAWRGCCVPRRRHRRNPEWTYRDPPSRSAFPSRRNTVRSVRCRHNACRVFSQ